MGAVEQAHDAGPTTGQGPFSFRIEHDPSEKYVIELLGELDLAGVELASEQLEMAAASGAREIVVDLSGLRFIDSSGLGVLVSANAREYSGTRLRFRRPSGAVARVISVTGLDEVLVFAD